MPKAKTPPPFGPIHRDYAESLAAVLHASEMIVIQIETALDLDQIKEPVATRLREQLAEYRRAWRGD